MIQSIGDLATSFVGRTANTRIRSELNTLVAELTSGRKADLRSALTGDLAPIAVIERSLANLDAYRTVTAEAELFTTSVQTALGQMNDYTDVLTTAAFALENTENPILIANFGAEAQNMFEAMVSTLNTRVAGRSLFAGSATDAAAVASPGLILDDLVANLPPGATAVDISNTVDAYFGPGGGFESGRYQGSTTPLSPFRLTPDDTIDQSLDATNGEILAGLKATAKGALISRGVLDGQPEQLNALVRKVGEDAMGAGAGLIGLRGEVGTNQARVEAAKTRNATETESLRAALSSLAGADPFETATRLQAVQTQLETFFTVTARLSQLNLAGYLR